jgi:hypothetical protein
VIPTVCGLDSPSATVAASEVHTNTADSAFLLLKRAVIGRYHHLSIKHLQRYLNEFCYSFNGREIADMFEQTVARMAGVGTRPMTS